ncbi:hypothetical protein JIN85_07300 [Luteolibacter pohnpeiensis]|uniref:TPM domain-containing protein n=1 Tax=Luteolibacter pohnpeiensis TaxID=454153 RepID=A0A934VW77_9BACT|nr:TPM domain-containing protein [Luteolibacter pohnpeiensis]MBK1882214.1 hypothetical protein [Luteolibacter pohnpeiensis]
MKCPRCVQQIHRAAESCPHCGFTLADADFAFGAEEVRLRRLTDAAGLIRRGDRARVEAALAKFSRSFPQLFFAVYTGSLGEVANIRQFGFWLLNRGAFEDVPVEIPNEAGILLTIDPESKAATITFGYLLDPYLDQADTFLSLSRAHAHWLEGKYADGIVRLVDHLAGVLKKRSRQARRDPERFEKKHQPAASKRDLIKKIRSGHQTSNSRPSKSQEVAR